MRYVQLFCGGFQGGLPPWLVIPVLWSCQRPIQIWLVNNLDLHICKRLPLDSVIEDHWFAQAGQERRARCIVLPVMSSTQQSAAESTTLQLT